MRARDKFNEKEKEIQDAMNYNYEKLIKEKDKHIKLCKEYIKLLEDDNINPYKDALNETLKENINLKKKLKAYEK